MHIVYLIEQIDQVGGIERSLITRVNYMVEVFKYKVTIVCTLKNTGIPAFELNDSINLIFLEKLTNKRTTFGRIFLRLEQAKMILNDLKPDIVISVKFTLHNLFFRLISNNVRFISELRESFANVNQKHSSVKTTSSIRFQNTKCNSHRFLASLSDQNG